MNTYIKYKNTWWKYDEATPANDATIVSNSGVRMCNIDISNLQQQKANSFFELDWLNTPVFSSKYKTGWLSPDGTFFGCDYHFHDDQAFLIHKKDEQKLENDGWIKISYDFVKNGIDSNKLEAFFNSNDEMVYPTNKQLAYIANNYSGNDKERMTTHLIHIRALKHQQISNDWGLER